MSDGLILGALFAVVVLLGLIGGLVWWVRRPVSARRDSHDALPLFGHDRAVVYPHSRDDDSDQEARAQVILAGLSGRPAAGDRETTGTPRPGSARVANDADRPAPGST